MEIKRIEYEFSVCKVIDYSLVDLNAEYIFIGKIVRLLAIGSSVILTNIIHIAWRHT